MATVYGNEGLKITLTDIPGLSVDQYNRAIFGSPFVFQCGPMEQYTITRTFNMGSYDTVDDDQYSRRGSRQLNTWQFDTLFMYIGWDETNTLLPTWVPYPDEWHKEAEWYRTVLRNCFAVGAPFAYSASYSDSLIHSTYATLMAFNEDYKFGEEDAIYFSGVSFQEWRDPRGSQQAAASLNAKLPAQVKFKIDPKVYRSIAYDVQTGTNVKTASTTKGTTFADLARAYYGDGSLWRTIANANGCKGGGGDSPIITTWYPVAKTGGKPTATIKVPNKP
jgi:hypothetical protein